ncbi:hypothetical protein BD779DRAFT_910874 [Infundibulicybe gibba]|nr:hypothetical protein BD779DRAFT_910874 [Infundibulicybe gibba]
MSDLPNIHEPAEDHRQQRTIVDLPMEILSEIFIQCIGVVAHERMGKGPTWYPPTRDWAYSWYSSPRDKSSEYYSGEAPLLPITHVCRHWRSVAISTPRLWARLPPIGEHNVLPESGEDKLFRIYLARSGKAPLSINISCWRDSRDEYMAALLSPHLHRAGKLRITYFTPSSTSPLDRLFVSLRGKFELLTHLHIGYIGMQHTPQYFDTFEHAPLLRNIFGRPQFFALPWSQIKRYCGKFRHVEHALCVLHQYAQLESLSLFFPHWHMFQEDETHLSTVPTPLPHLLELRIIDEVGTVEQLIPLLHAPLLEVVQISEVYRNLPIPQNLITRLTQSQCTGLTSLQLLCYPMDTSQLRQLAGLAPGLRELDAYLTSDAFREFLYSSAAPNIFPRLVRLIIHQVGVDDEDLIRILQSRITPSLYDGSEGCQVERLQYCQIYPVGDKQESFEAAWRIQDVVESSRDTSVEPLEAIDSDSDGASPPHQIYTSAQEDAATGVEWVVREDEHGWYTVIWRPGLERDVKSRFIAVDVDVHSGEPA